MQLRFGWSPINHMGKNPCMQRSLRALLAAKEARVRAGEAGVKLNFSSEEIMVTNLQCVRPCYAANASGVGQMAESEVWHDEAQPACKNIYFTPLVHSMYAMHIRRWMSAFSREALLLLRFDDLVLRPLDVLHKLAEFLQISRLPASFKVEVRAVSPRGVGGTARAARVSRPTRVPASAIGRWAARTSQRSPDCCKPARCPRRASKCCRRARGRSRTAAPTSSPHHSRASPRRISSPHTTRCYIGCSPARHFGEFSSMSDMLRMDARAPHLPHAHVSQRPDERAVANCVA
eukprot:2244206-Prymnesium_polylepis.1